jgi:hypothetical protein
VTAADPDEAFRSEFDAFEQYGAPEHAAGEFIAQALRKRPAAAAPPLAALVGRAMRRFAAGDAGAGAVSEMAGALACVPWLLPVRPCHLDWIGLCLSDR